MTPRAAFWCACSIWALTLAATATALVYSAVRPLPASLVNLQGSRANGVVGIVFITGFATVGALLVWKRAGNPIGWLLSATGLSYAAGAFEVLLAHFPSALTFVNWSGWIWLVGLGFAVFVLLLFPTGHLPSRRWRPVAWAAAAGLAAWVLGNAFAPRIVSANTPTPNPIGVPAPAGNVFLVLAIGGMLLIAATGLAAVISLAFRYRRASTVEREQLKWLVYAGALIVLALLAEPFAEPMVGPGNASSNLQNAVSTGGAALIPCAIGIAIFRYHLYDIDVVINKTLVYGSLAAFITAVYVAIVVGVGSLVAQHGNRASLWLSIAATAVVAVAFQPVWARIQHLAHQAGHPVRGPRGVRRAHGGNLRHRGTAAPHGADPGRGHRGLPGGRVAAGRGSVQGRCHLAARRAAVR